MKARELSYELRRVDNRELTLRRWVAGLSMAAAGTMAIVGLYQTGILRHLPEPRHRRLDADRVDASAEAYQRLLTPDAYLSMISYSITAATAAMGEADRSRRRPWVSLLMAGKTLVDAAWAAKLTRDQWRNHRAFCSYCLAAAAMSFAAAALSVPEALGVLRNLKPFAHRRQRLYEEWAHEARHRAPLMRM